MSSRCSSAAISVQSCPVIRASILLGTYVMVGIAGVRSFDGGEGLATLSISTIDTVMFDKTGTLTLGGEPSITDTEFYVGGDGAWKSTLLAAVKAVEESSTHPIAKAVAAYSASEASGRVIIDNLNELAGKGMAATCSSLDAPDAQFEILVGSEALLADFSVDIPQAAPIVSSPACCRRKRRRRWSGSAEEPGHGWQDRGARAASLSLPWWATESTRRLR